MHSKIALFAAVSAALVSSCMGDFWYLQSEPIPDAMDMPPSKFAHCATAEQERMDPALYTAAKFEHEPAPGLDVYEEVPVSAQGCVRYFQHIQNGRVVSLGVVRYLGFFEVYNEPNGDVAFREAAMFLTRETRTDTTNTIEIDSDGNGHIAVVMRANYDEVGLVEQVITFFAASNGQISERRVLRRVDSSTVRWTEETLVAGELVLSRDDLAPARMEATFEGPGACYIKGTQDNVGCDKDDKKLMEEQLQEALKQGSECLARQKSGEATNSDRELLQHIIKSRGPKIVMGCYEGGTGHAYLDPVNRGNPTGERLVMVNIGTLRCQSPRFVASTLFHEVLHITRGPHQYDTELNDLTNQGKMSQEAYRYTDSIRACEAFCFEGLKNRCSCAACFQVKTCNEPCAKEADCRVQDQSGKYLMSEAVGALCVPQKYLTIGKREWFATMEACRQNCGGPSYCKSYSLSCRTNCN